MPTEHFKSKEAYRKNMAYRHIHGIASPNLKRVIIGGVGHDVKHDGKKRKGRKTAARKR